MNKINMNINFIHFLSFDLFDKKFILKVASIENFERRVQ
jgi:hypothetical protein